MIINSFPARGYKGLHNRDFDNFQLVSSWFLGTHFAKEIKTKKTANWFLPVGR